MYFNKLYLIIGINVNYLNKWFCYYVKLMDRVKSGFLKFLYVIIDFFQYNVGFMYNYIVQLFILGINEIFFILIKFFFWSMFVWGISFFINSCYNCYFISVRIDCGFSVCCDMCDCTFGVGCYMCDYWQDVCGYMCDYWFGVCVI